MGNKNFVNSHNNNEYIESPNDVVDCHPFFISNPFKFIMIIIPPLCLYKYKLTHSNEIGFYSFLMSNLFMHYAGGIIIISSTRISVAFGMKMLRHSLTHTHPHISH